MPSQARQKFAQDAVVYGYRYLAIGHEVWSVEQPASMEQLPILKLTEIRVDDSLEFVPWVVVRDYKPLSFGGEMAVFADPCEARIQAARNAGQAMLAEEFFKIAAERQRSQLILPPSIK